MKDLTPGIHKDIPIDVYHANPLIVSSTGLKEAKKSSRHFAYYITEEREDKPCFDFGNAFENFLLDCVNGDMTFDKVATIYDPENRPEKEKGITSKVNQDWKKEVYDSGKYIVKKEGAESFDTIQQMADSCMSDPLIEKLLSKVEYQQSLVWKDDTGIMCKTRPDFSLAKKNVIVNLKTTLDASPEGFARQCANLDYPLQAYMEIEGALQTGFIRNIDVYFWLAVEKKPPYNAVLYEFQKQDIERMADAYGFYIKRCAKVINDMKAGKRIKGYSEQGDQHGIVQLEIPLYYRP